VPSARGGVPCGGDGIESQRGATEEVLGPGARVLPELPAEVGRRMARHP